MKKIVSSLALASILVSGLYAQQGQQNQKNLKNPQGQYCDFKKDGKNGYMYKNGLLAMFSELNLSADQKTKIDEIIKDSRKDQEFPCDAFSKDSFDKAKFAKIMKDKQENKSEQQAEILDKAYKVLDAKQKEQLRTLLDLRKEKMKQRFED